jgi:predicted exporter
VSAVRGLALVVVLVMAAYCITHMRVVSDITSFMPASGSSEFAAISRSLADSELTRQMVVSLGAPEPELAVRGARALAETLRSHPEVEWLRVGVEDDQLDALYQLYFPRRHYFVSDDPAELEARLSDEGLARSAARLRTELARPSATLVARIAAQDPLLAFPALLERVRGSDRRIALRDGVFTSRSGEHAILLLGTRASPFDSARQRPLLEAIEARVAAISDELGAPLVLESTGVNRFALDIEDGIRGEIGWLLAVSFLGTALLFLAFFRSLRALALAMLPHALGVLLAATVGLALFGHLNGLAIAFGISLIGVSIDYSIHLLNHHALAPPGTSASSVLRRLRPSLLLGGATTIASLAGLAFGNFPGFHQMGVLATVGVAAALAVSLLLVPDLMAGRPAPVISQRSAILLGGLVLALRRHRRSLLAVPVVCVGLGIWGATRIVWIDDLAQLQNVSEAVRAEASRVRARLTNVDATRFLIAEGENVGDALAANDRLALRLPALVESGALSGFRSLHAYLWSEPLQQANLAALRADPSLPARLDAAYTRAGFQPGAFAPFAESLEEPPPPLTLPELAASPAGDVVRSLLLDFGDRRAVVTQLEGVRDPDAIVAMVAELPGVRFFDQQRFFRDVYGEYRERIVAVVISGCFAVFALLLLRYRALRPALAAALPSLLVAFLLVALAAALRVPIHILHLIGLILVMGMGVDYGIFVWDTAESDEAVGTTMQSLLLSALTTIFVFGVLGFSAHPVLNAIGRTAAVGIALAFLLAPVSLVLVGPTRGRAGSVRV